MSRATTMLVGGAIAVGMFAACADARDRGEPGVAASAASAMFARLGTTNSGTYSLHLQDVVRFNAIQPGADADRGRRLFGLAPDLQTEDSTEALFQGPSAAFGGTVVSNGRSCFTCHRGLDVGLGLPKPPLSASVALTDPLFTGLDGDAQNDPDGMRNLDQLALMKYRPNRFNLTRDQSDPYRQLFFWRKSIRLINLAFAHGFLNDGRGRVMFEVDRGAVFSHTQESDKRFDDLFTAKDGNDLEAFQFSNLSDPRLAALRNPSDPLYATLVNEPFYTVSIATDAQRRGRHVFEKSCMSCHNTPNIFNNVSNVEPLGNGDSPVTNPGFGPNVGRNFNVGVSERNRHGLRFTHFAGPGRFTPIVIPLANEDGTTNLHEVRFDIGLAATSGRAEDIGRFKVPQLRGVKDAGPYFHDNSAATLEEVVDYFNGPDYNGSRDGRLYPIHLNANQRADLLEFLKAL